MELAVNLSYDAFSKSTKRGQIELDACSFCHPISGEVQQSQLSVLKHFWRLEAVGTTGPVQIR